jgi:hypothetical protein
LGLSLFLWLLLVALETTASKVPKTGWPTCHVNKARTCKLGAAPGFTAILGSFFVELSLRHFSNVEGGRPVVSEFLDKFWQFLNLKNMISTYLKKKSQVHRLAISSHT